MGFKAGTIFWGHWRRNPGIGAAVVRFPPLATAPFFPLLDAAAEHKQTLISIYFGVQRNCLLALASLNFSTILIWFARNDKALFFSNSLKGTHSGSHGKEG